MTLTLQTFELRIWAGASGLNQGSSLSSSFRILYDERQSVYVGEKFQLICAGETINMRLAWKWQSSLFKTKPKDINDELQPSGMRIVSFC